MNNNYFANLLLIVRKSLRQHALSPVVTALAIALASGLVLSVFAIQQQTRQAFTGGETGFDAVLGDGRQEIVFIGINLDSEKLVAELNDCLTSEMEAELSANDWSKIKHPFAAWDGEIEYLAEAAGVH